jgi:G3E family GTPase
MRTPVVLVCGQGDADGVAGTLMKAPGTAVVGHEFDGHVVRRWVSILRHGELSTSEVALELRKGCVPCTVRNDLLVLVRRIHRRDDVERIVVLLAPWMEPEPVCYAINHVRVHVGTGYIDGPPARDVEIRAVVACIDADTWLTQTLGNEELDDGRTVAQVVVGQAEFADVVVLTQPEPATLAVVKRLAPRSRITVGTRNLEMALQHLDPHARRGADTDPHEPLLAGQPPLTPEGEVTLVEFAAHRPFHPLRLHSAIDSLLDGVVRARGRVWLASQPDNVVWIESAGGGLRVANAGSWLAAMNSSELAYTDRERQAMASTHWDHDHGDRHVSMTILVCGAQPGEITDALQRALLTDDEFSRPQQWSGYDDPFGDWHDDPCDSTPESLDEISVRGAHEGDDT